MEQSASAVRIKELHYDLAEDIYGGNCYSFLCSLGLVDKIFKRTKQAAFSR